MVRDPKQYGDYRWFCSQAYCCKPTLLSDKIYVNLPMNGPCYRLDIPSTKWCCRCTFFEVCIRAVVPDTSAKAMFVCTCVLVVRIDHTNRLANEERSVDLQCG